MIQKAALILEDETIIPLAMARGAYRWKTNTIKRNPRLHETTSPGLIETGHVLTGEFTFRLTLKTTPHLLRLIAGTHIETKHVPGTRGLFQETREIGDPPPFTLELQEEETNTKLETIRVSHFKLQAKQLTPILLTIEIEGDTEPQTIPLNKLTAPYAKRYFYLSAISHEELQIEGFVQGQKDITLWIKPEWKSDSFLLIAHCAEEYELNWLGLFNLKIEAISFDGVNERANISSYLALGKVYIDFYFAST